MVRASALPIRAALSAALIALALLLRVAVPGGWMPAETGFGIVPCAGMGPMRLGKPSHHHHHGRGKQEREAAQPCPFTAFAAAVTTPPAPPVLAPPPPPVAAPSARTMFVGIARGLAAPPPPATGPPALA